MTYDLAPEEPPPPPPQGVPELDSQMRPRRWRPAVIEVDLPCIRCGYNLRSLRRAGLCPECGAAVVVSEAGEELVNASPAWLRVVKQGLLLLLWSVALAFCAALLRGMALSGPVDTLGDALWLFGILLLTTREPREQLTERGANLRNGLRLAAGLMFCCDVVTGVARVLQINAAVLPWAGSAARLLRVGVIVGTVFYLRRLAGRMADIELERLTLLIMWGLVVSCVAVAVFVPLDALLPTRSRGPATCGLMVSTLALGIFLLAFLRLLYKYYHVIKWVAHEAQYRVDAGLGA